MIRKIISSIGTILALASLLMALAGQAGRWKPALDIINSTAPLVLGAAILAMVLSLAVRRSRKFGLLFAMMACVMTAERIIPEYWADLPSANSATSHEVTILTFNVGRNTVDPDTVRSAIMAADADVLLLQETRSAFEQILKKLERRYPYRTDCGHRACDAAILSRWPIAPVRGRFRDAANRKIGPMVMRTVVSVPNGRSFAVATLHFARPSLNDVAIDRTKSLAKALREVDTSRLVLTGDFNLTPWSFALQALDRETPSMKRVTRHMPTYPADLIFPAFLPIDHVYIGQGWLVRSVERLPPAGSDHLGVKVVLRPS